MKEVKSSTISHVGYEDSTNTLKIRFKDGAEYHYQNVPKKEHDSLLNAESVGKHFVKNIRNSYKFNKVNERNLKGS